MHFVFACWKWQTIALACFMKRREGGCMRKGHSRVPTARASRLRARALGAFGSRAAVCSVLHANGTPCDRVHRRLIFIHWTEMAELALQCISRGCLSLPVHHFTVLLVQSDHPSTPKGPRLLRRLRRLPASFDELLGHPSYFLQRARGSQALKKPWSCQYWC